MSLGILLKRIQQPLEQRVRHRCLEGSVYLLLAPGCLQTFQPPTDIGRAPHTPAQKHLVGIKLSDQPPQL
jgi:hypothetical protein